MFMSYKKIYEIEQLQSSSDPSSIFQHYSVSLPKEERVASPLFRYKFVKNGGQCRIIPSIFNAVPEISPFEGIQEIYIDPEEALFLSLKYKIHIAEPKRSLPAEMTRGAMISVVPTILDTFKLDDFKFADNTTLPVFGILLFGSIVLFSILHTILPGFDAKLGGLLPKFDKVSLSWKQLMMEGLKIFAMVTVSLSGVAAGKEFAQKYEYMQKELIESATAGTFFAVMSNVITTIEQRAANWRSGKGIIGVQLITILKDIIFGGTFIEGLQFLQDVSNKYLPWMPYIGIPLNLAYIMIYSYTFKKMFTKINNGLIEKILGYNIGVSSCCSYLDPRPVLSYLRSCFGYGNNEENESLLGYHDSADFYDSEA
jgi:hypothetical protein